MSIDSHSHSLLVVYVVHGSWRTDTSCVVVVFVMLFSGVNCIIMYELCDSKARSKPIRTQHPTACAVSTPHKDAARIIGLGEVEAHGGEQ